MNLRRLDVFAMLTARMDWLTARQQVLARNVANADTPEYQARDLKTLDFRTLLRGQASQVAMAVTNQAHLAGSAPGAPDGRWQTVKQRYEAVPSGNAVVLEEEMMKVARTAADYELMTNLYQRHVGLIKAAVGRGR